MWTPSRVLLNGVMSLAAGNASITQSHTLKGAFLGLLREAISYTPDSDDSIVTSKEANYQGYARQAISSWSGPFVGQVGFSLEEGGAKLWQPTGDDTTNTIFGQFLIGSDSATILGVEIFDSSIPLPSPSDAFVSVPIFGVGPNTAGYGSSIVSQ